MALITIDFDYTIVNGHTHNKIKYSQETNKDSQWDQIKDFATVGNPGEWKHILKTLIKEGHSICIVSFNSYGHIIPRYLLEKIGLSNEDIKKIKVISWLPSRPETANKNQHIQQAKKITRFLGKNSQVILIDDTKDNIDAASKENYRTITADKDGAYLSNIIPLVGQLKFEASLCKKFKTEYIKQSTSKRFYGIKAAFFSKTIRLLRAGGLDDIQSINQYVNANPDSRAAHVWQHILSG
jgi:hypothetical protein